MKRFENDESRKEVLVLHKLHMQCNSVFKYQNTDDKCTVSKTKHNQDALSDSDSSLPDFEVAYAQEISKFGVAGNPDIHKKDCISINDPEPTWLSDQRRYYENLNAAIKRSLEDLGGRKDAYSSPPHDQCLPTSSNSSSSSQQDNSNKMTKSECLYESPPCSSPHSVHTTWRAEDEDSNQGSHKQHSHQHHSHMEKQHSHQHHSHAEKQYSHQHPGHSASQQHSNQHRSHVFTEKQHSVADETPRYTYTASTDKVRIEHRDDSAEKESEQSDHHHHPHRRQSEDSKMEHGRHHRQHRHSHHRHKTHHKHKHSSHKERRRSSKDSERLHTDKAIRDLEDSGNGSSEKDEKSHHHISSHKDRRSISIDSERGLTDRQFSSLDTENISEVSRLAKDKHSSHKSNRSSSRDSALSQKEKHRYQKRSMFENTESPQLNTSQCEADKEKEVDLKDKLCQREVSIVLRRCNSSNISESSHKRKASPSDSASDPKKQKRLVKSAASLRDSASDLHKHKVAVKSAARGLKRSLPVCDDDDSHSSKSDTDSEPAACKVQKVDGDAGKGGVGCDYDQLLTRQMSHKLDVIQGRATCSCHRRKQRHRTVWDKTIYDPEYSDGEAAAAAGTELVDYDSSEDMNQQPDLEKLESQLNPRCQPIVALEKLSSSRDNDDIVWLKNYSEVQKCLSGLKVQQRRGSSSPARHFLDVLQPSGGSSPVAATGSPRSVHGLSHKDGSSSSYASPAGSRRGSQELEDRGSLFSFASPVTSRRESEISEKDVSPSPSRRASESYETGDHSRAPVISAGHGPHKLRRIPRVSSAVGCSVPTPAAPPVVASTLKREDDTGRLMRDVVPGALNKPRVPALFSVPAYAPSGIVDRSAQHVVMFSRSQEDLAYANLEEKDKWEYKMQGVLTIADMSNSGTSPSRELLEDLLLMLTKAPKRQFAVQIHNVLMRILHQHPPYAELCFTWRALEEAVKKAMKKALSGGEASVEAHRNYLAFQYMVAALESDVLQRSFNSQQQLNRSVTFRWLCSAGAFHRVNQLLGWLVEADDGMFPLIDQLLELAMAVHQRPDELAAKCAGELEIEYIRYSSLTQKHTLLSGLSSPLLVLKLCQRILEDHCSAGTTYTTYTLEDLLPAYFSACPPRLSSSPPVDTEADSPPPSPPLHKHLDAPQPPAPAAISEWSVGSCEELCMLLWFAVRCYIQCKQHRLHLPVPERQQYGPQRRPLEDCDVAMLQRLPHFVTDLQNTLKRHCEKEALSDKTILYLAKLSTLSQS